MYNILFTTDQYYKLDTSFESNKECIICWIPASKDIPVKCMKNYPLYISNCKCNAFFHDNCLTKWFNKQSSCPICRSNISIKNIQNNEYSVKIKTYIDILLKNILYSFRMLSFLYIVNLFFITFYNIIFIDFTLDNYSYNNQNEHE